MAAACVAARRRVHTRRLCAALPSRACACRGLGRVTARADAPKPAVCSATSARNAQPQSHPRPDVCSPPAASLGARLLSRLAPMQTAVMRVAQRPAPAALRARARSSAARQGGAARRHALVVRAAADAESPLPAVLAIAAPVASVAIASAVIGSGGARAAQRARTFLSPPSHATPCASPPAQPSPRTRSARICTPLLGSSLTPTPPARSRSGSSATCTVAIWPPCCLQCVPSQ